MRQVRGTTSWGFAVLLVVTGCGASGSTSPVPTAVGTARFGCVDQPGTISATAAQWYLGEQGGSIETGWQPVDFPRTAFFPVVGAALQAAVPDAGVTSGDYGQEATDPGGCATVRWVDLYDARSHSYFVSVLRPESRVDLRSRHEGAAFRVGGDDLIVGTLHDPEGVTVLAVTADGTTARLIAYGADLPPTSQLVRATRDILEQALALREQGE